METRPDPEFRAAWDRLERRLRRTVGPTRAQQRRAELEGCYCEAMRRSQEQIEASLDEPARLQALIRFWHDFRPPGVLQ